MKREVFVKYVKECIEKGMTTQEIINEIDGMVSKFGQLILYDGNKKPIIIEKFWLNNFAYKDFIKKKRNIMF